MACRAGLPLVLTHSHSFSLISSPLPNQYSDPLPLILTRPHTPSLILTHIRRRRPLAGRRVHDAAHRLLLDLRALVGHGARLPAARHRLQVDRRVVLEVGVVAH